MNTKQQAHLQAQPWLLTHKENERTGGWTIYPPSGLISPWDVIAFSENELRMHQLLWRKGHINDAGVQRHSYKLENQSLIFTKSTWIIEEISAEKLILNNLDTLYHFIPACPESESLDILETLLTSKVWEEVSNEEDMEKGDGNFTLFLMETCSEFFHDDFQFKVMLQGSYSRYLMPGFWNEKTVGWKLCEMEGMTFFKVYNPNVDLEKEDFTSNYLIVQESEDQVLLKGEIERRFRIKK